MYGNATKDAANGVEEESSTCLTIESTGALWSGHP